MNLWIKLSDPVYQFPEIICESAQELADRCGVSRATIFSCWCRYLKGEAAYSRYMKVVIDEEDEDE